MTMLLRLSHTDRNALKMMVSLGVIDTKKTNEDHAKTNVLVDPKTL